MSAQDKGLATRSNGPGCVIPKLVIPSAPVSLLMAICPAQLQLFGRARHLRDKDGHDPFAAGRASRLRLVNLDAVEVEVERLSGQSVRLCTATGGRCDGVLYGSDCPVFRRLLLMFHSVWSERGCMPVALAVKSPYCAPTRKPNESLTGRRSPD